MKMPALPVSLAFTALCALGLTGCTHRLPSLKAEEVHSRTSVMGVTSTADATGISVTDTTIKAAEAKWTISFPGFDHTTTTKGYQQKREKEDRP